MDGWKVIDIANQYGVSKQVVFNYLNEMKAKNIKGFKQVGNQFLINQVGYNYILQKREGLIDRVKKINDNKPPIPDTNQNNLMVENAILKERLENLSKALADKEQQLKELRMDLQRNETKLDKVQQDYTELTNKTIGLLLTDGSTPEQEPKRKFWWWNKKK